MAESVEALGRVDFVCANAGRGKGAASFTEMTTETWRYNTSLNLDGAFWTLREAAKHMMARAKAGDPGGSLTVTASLAAREAAARNQAYAATKAGVIAMMRGIAVEYARYGIRANSILPGWIATEMTQGRARQRQVHHQRHHARAHAQMGRTGGFRRHRGLPRLRRLQVPHRR